jgi:hypothetical protein
MRDRPGRGKGKYKGEEEEEGKGLPPVMLVHVFTTNTTERPCCVRVLLFFYSSTKTKQHLPPTHKKNKNKKWKISPKNIMQYIHETTLNGTEIENRKGSSSCRAA